MGGEERQESMASSCRGSATESEMDSEAHESFKESSFKLEDRIHLGDLRTARGDSVSNPKAPPMHITDKLRR